MNPEKAKDFLEYDDDNIERPFEDYGCEEALADYLDLDPDEVHDAEYDHFGLRVFETDDGREYLVTDDYDEVESACHDEISSLVEDLGYDALNWDNIGGIENFVDVDWFEEAIRESFEYYVDDIRNEEASDDSYANRLEEEMADYGVDDEEEFIDRMVENADDPVQYYIDNFGKENFTESVNQHNLFDMDKIVEAVMDTDDSGTILASYDNEEHEFDYKGHTFWAYRIN